MSRAVAPYHATSSDHCSSRQYDSKYQYMEVSLQTRRKGIESKIPDIAETLKVVKFLEARRVSLGQLPTISSSVLNDST